MYVRLVPIPQNPAVGQLTPMPRYWPVRMHGPAETVHGKKLTPAGGLSMGMGLMQQTAGESLMISGIILIIMDIWNLTAMWSPMRLRCIIGLEAMGPGCRNGIRRRRIEGVIGLCHKNQALNTPFIKITSNSRSVSDIQAKPLTIHVLLNNFLVPGKLRRGCRKIIKIDDWVAP